MRTVSMSDEELRHMGKSNTSMIKPGMSHIVNAGETLLIRDNEGQEIAIEAREHDGVIAFIRAYDELRIARAHGVTGVVLDSFEHRVERAFTSLPSHVARVVADTRGLVLP